MDTDVQLIRLPETNGHGAEQRQDYDEKDAKGINHPTEQRQDNDEGDAKGTAFPNIQPTIARMPTEKNSVYYNMKHKKRGLALIFNHEHFDIHGLKSRSGTNVDCSTLSNSLKTLGFTVSVFPNLNQKELCDVISDVSKLDHTDHDCILICVLSHGEMGILYAKDTFYKPEMLWHSFTADRCPSLAGKPKMFFIQACQGDKLDGGVLMSNRTETDGPGQATFRIPIHADFLISYSTVPGYYSWRNTTRGSWFIQALAEELRYYGKDRDILTLLTFVSQRVAYDYESNTPDSPIMHQQKQIPCITTMLTRLLVFGEK